MKRFCFILLLCAVLSAKPSIHGVYFDGRLFYSGNSIGRQPEIEVRVTSAYEIPYDGIELYLEGTGALELAEKKQGPDGFRLRLLKELPVGENQLRIIVRDDNYSEEDMIILDIVVLAGRDLHGEMVIFPSPATGNINVCYELGEAQSISLLVYDLNGQVVCRRDFTAGYPGGNGGYNQVDIDLHSRRQLSNGVYVAVLLKKSGSRSILAREKFIVLR